MTEPSETQPAPSPGPRSAAAERRNQRSGSEASLAGLGFGLIVLAIGIWYFLDQTLGLEMPRIDWRAAWPVFLIAIGAVLVFRSAGRRD
jgi:hypothetical protein